MTQMFMSVHFHSSQIKLLRHPLPHQHLLFIISPFTEEQRVFPCWWEMEGEMGLSLGLCTEGCCYGGLVKEITDVSCCASWIPSHVKTLFIYNPVHIMTMFICVSAQTDSCCMNAREKDLRKAILYVLSYDWHGILYRAACFPLNCTTRIQG